MPMLSIFFFIFTICKAAVPLSANWIEEFLCLTGIIQSPIICFISSSGIVLSAAYIIFVYNRIAIGFLVLIYQIIKILIIDNLWYYYLY